MVVDRSIINAEETIARGQDTAERAAPIPAQFFPPVAI